MSSKLNFSEYIVSSLASILSALPLMVFISPLCTMSLFGCALFQLGFVFVENLECTSATADLKSKSSRSLKNFLSCPTRNIPL